MDCRVEIPRDFDCQVVLPVSKSIAARALIINALMPVVCNHDLFNSFKTKEEGVGSENDSSECTSFLVEQQSITPQCDDIDILTKALNSDRNLINVGDSGAAMRFLTAFYACREGRAVTLDGSERLRQRPVGPLVDALRLMGASIDYLGNEGYPPFKISGKRLNGGSVSIKGDVSSQFVSALLMIAPVAGGMTMTLEGEVMSRPYIDMTMAVMRHYGVDARWKKSGNKSQIIVPPGHYIMKPLAIEGDWSAASYWFALKALLPQSRIVLSPLCNNSLQGDKAIVEMMAPLGVNARFDGNNTVVLFSDNSSLVPTHYERDMAATPDLVPTLAVTLCLMRVPFSLTGVRNLRIKESDRLEALREELSKLGYSLEVGDNILSYNGNHVEPQGEIIIDPHGDHRIAMAMSLAATRHKIIIKDAKVVTKSYPGWWEALRAVNRDRKS
ncbi:MAG: 3-phosphoshikimate 1-carboxyvinyltransferase [Muribaculaceae bacterium]|nr:3-phosphoshikimate 1-carboxyvinyltransferase [Muribaculaceae bacterium]